MLLYEESVMDTPALFGHDDTANYVVYPKDTQDEGKSFPPPITELCYLNG